MAVRGSETRTPSSLVLLAVHEDFHGYQRGRFIQGYEPYEVEDPEDVALAGRENQALVRWLEKGDAETLRDFAAARMRRRKLLPGTTAETGEENLEGTARYVELGSGEALGESSHEALIRALREPVQIEDMAKRRLYAVGAASCLYLESETPGSWQNRVETGERVSEMVLDRLGVSSKEADARVSRLTSGPEYAAMLSRAREGVSGLQARREETLRAFESSDGTKVRLTGGLSRHFVDNGAWFRYRNGTLLHEHVIEWFGEGPGSRLKLFDRMVLEADDGIEFYIDSAARIVIDGRDWSGEGLIAFKTMSISAPGAEIFLQGGSVEREGSGLSIAVDPATR
jgi:hypothetical protein